ncbi:MAG: single-stranded DNA-binding protein [Firmicutes bacterium]|nr:single-stranded DNA-binding protein [Bacillota bacterium]
MNKCILVGNLTRDPETSTTGTGITVCKFGVAVNRSFTNASGEREADFFNIVAWRNLGENCGKYLTKGSKVAISGRIETRTYEKDGVKHHATDIVADDVEFLSRAGGEGQASGGQSFGGGSGGAKKQNSELKPIEDDGLPF